MGISHNLNLSRVRVRVKSHSVCEPVFYLLIVFDCIVVVFSQCKQPAYRPHNIMKATANLAGNHCPIVDRKYEGFCGMECAMITNYSI